jgi:hypothetical protein
MAHKNIGEAWLAIMKEVGYVQKKGKNVAQNYKYAGEAQLIEALRPVFLEHDVICVPGEVKVISTESVVTGSADKEKKTFRIVAEYTYVYTHVPSGTHMQVMAIGEGVDTGDKAAYKAATGALKYSLRQPFLIETGDDPEKDDKPEQANTPVFSTNAKRNDWSAKLEKRMRDSIDLEELKGIWAEEQPILNELKSSKFDYDVVAFDHLEKTKESCKEHHKKAAQ